MNSRALLAAFLLSPCWCGAAVNAVPAEAVAGSLLPHALAPLILSQMDASAPKSVLPSLPSPALATSPGFAIRSQTEGRLRVDIPALAGNPGMAREIERALTVPELGIVSVRANPLVGSALIRIAPNSPGAWFALQLLSLHLSGGPDVSADPAPSSEAVFDGARALLRRASLPLEPGEILSSIPGRLRIRVPAARVSPGSAAEIARTISGLEDVRDVAANPLTGSVLIHYDASVKPERLLERMRGLRYRAADGMAGSILRGGDVGRLGDLRGPILMEVARRLLSAAIRSRLGRAARWEEFLPPPLALLAKAFPAARALAQVLKEEDLPAALLRQLIAQGVAAGLIALLL